MGQYSNMFDILLGTADFQAEDLIIKNDPVMVNNLETGRKITLTVPGTITGSSAADYATKLAAMQAAVGANGQNFLAKGLGGNTVFQLAAATCLNGGPHVSWKQEPLSSTPALTSRFTIELNADTASQAPPGQQQSGQTLKYKTATAPDGQIVLTISGPMNGPTATADFATFLQNTAQIYPWPNYVISYDQEKVGTGDALTVDVRVKALATPLPMSPNAKAVDGTTSYTKEVDENGKQTGTRTYDLLVTGNPYALEFALRPTWDLSRASVRITGYDQVRLQATYVWIISDDGTGLVSWTNAIEWEQEDATVRPVRYDGIASRMVWNNKNETVRTVRITGRATICSNQGSKTPMKPPTPPDLSGMGGGYFPAENGRKPRIENVDKFTWQTSWDYEYVGTGGIGDADVATLMKAMARPVGKPNFF